MGMLIGIVVVVALVIGLLLWTSRPRYKPDGSQQNVRTARQTRLDGKEKGARWGAGGG